MKQSLDKQIPSALNQLYSTVPNHEEILAGVRVGRQRFEEDVKRLGFDNPHMSQVHSYEDVEAQAFTVAITGGLSPEEVAIKAYHVYGAHFFDDFSDRPDLNFPDEKINETRMDIHASLKGLGRLGEFAEEMAQMAQHPEGVYKGLHRIMLGSLAQKATSEEQRAALLREFKIVGLQGINPALARDIEGLPDNVYWMTTKSDMELVNSSDPSFSMDIGEVWNLIYAPALYYHDINKELDAQESIGTAQPTIEEMTLMIDTAEKHIASFPDDRLPGRITQLRFLLSSSSRVLPERIIVRYQQLLEQLEKQATKE